MSLPSNWRQFQLLDFLPIRDPNFKSENPLFSDPLLSAITSTLSYIVYVAQNATVKILQKDTLVLAHEYSSYEPDYRVTFMQALPHTNLLVTLAEKQMAPSIIKIWDLNKISQLSSLVMQSDDTMRHKFITQVQIHDIDNSFPISCFVFNDLLTCMAVGYANGRVILIRGDLLRDRGLKQRLIYEGSDPITGLQFHRSEEILYVVTTSKIFTMVTSGRNKGKPLRMLSNSHGASLGCSDAEQRSSRLIVADTEGFAYYNHITKAHSVPFSIPKRNILKIYKDYLLLVCPIEEDSSSSGRSILTRLLVLDMHNMHVSFSLTIPDLSISHLFLSAGEDEVFLLSTDGVLYKLREKPINQQIEIIIQRELFSIALNLAKQHNLDKKSLLRINKLHADYLYERQDYDASVAKYIDCLSLFSEVPEDENFPNLDEFVISVVTKFREAPNVYNMTTFLSELYKQGLSDSDHLTLLLCCYCKLKMISELDDFIYNLNLNAENNPRIPDMYKMDFSLIINLFRECGCFNQVIQLLFKLNRPLLIVDIQLNDLHQHSKCMAFIKSLPINELLGILIDYLKNLLDSMPIESTKLMVEVFTGVYQPTKSNGLLGEDELEDENETPDKAENGVHTSSYSALLGYLSNPLWQSNEGDATNSNSLQVNEPTYIPPRPSLVFACFADHPKEFVVFLEACFSTVDKCQGGEAEKSGIVATLFETYLAMSIEDPENENEWRSKAQEFAIANVESLDMSTTTLVSQIYGLQLDESLARRNNETYEEDLFYTKQKSGDLEKTFEVVRQYGGRKPILYKLMLHFIVSSDENLAQTSRSDFSFLLHKIMDHKLANLPEIIKILSTNPNASIGIVKDILIESISDSKREIDNNVKLIESYESESTKNSVKLTDLTTKAILLENKICSTCKLKLEYPTIYFKCKHAYHQKCLDENIYIPDSSESLEPKCPLCAHELREVEELHKSQAQTKEDYDWFHQKMEESEDRFKVIGEYIGRGIMDDD